MKRDMELVRQLLFLVEGQDDDKKELNIPSNIDRNVAVYHLKLLEQVGYTENRIHYADDNPMWIYSSVTWEGHEFLNAIKSENVWNKIKEKLGSDISSLPIAVISQVAIEAAKTWAFNKLGFNTN